jgi:hypothetical protein
MTLPADQAIRAKASIKDSDIRRTWILLGDPAIEAKVAAL